VSHVAGVRTVVQYVEKKVSRVFIKANSLLNVAF